MKSTSCASARRLKIDLHTHTADDPKEEIQYTAGELIDKAHYLGFDAICITNHDAICAYEYHRDYARERGILLLPGTEICVRGKHVLVINAHEDILAVRTFDDLRRLRRPDCLVVAPHPYFPALSSLLWKMRRNIDVFDAIEFSWFYNSHINFNQFAVRVAEEFELPLVCTSDCHNLSKFGSAYSFVEAEKDAESILEAVRAGRIEIAASPINLADLSKYGVKHVVGVTVGLFKNLMDGDNR